MVGILSNAIRSSLLQATPAMRNALKKTIRESKQLQEEKRKSAVAKWKSKKSVQQDERSRRLVQEKPHSQFWRESLPATCRVTRSKFVFLASEAVISPVNVKLQLQLMHHDWPVTQHSRREASNNYVLPTELYEVEHCSVEFDCVELDHSVSVKNIELVCATPVKGRLKEYLTLWKDIGASKWVQDVLRDG